MFTDMSERNGFQLLEALSKNGNRPLVLRLSGSPDVEYAQKPIRLDVTHALLKLTVEQTLTQSMGQALEAQPSTERVGQTVKPPIDKAIEYIRDHVDGRISLRQVADVVHLNPSYFSVLFKKQTGMTFSEYVTRKRIDVAKSLLLSTSLSVDEIAWKSGYRTTKYFIKVFKAYERVTPGKYRTQYAEHLLSKDRGILPKAGNLDAYYLAAILIGNPAEQDPTRHNVQMGGLEMLKKAYLLLLASALTFPIGLAAYSDGVEGANDSVETVKFMHLWPSGSSRQHNLIVQEIVEQFESVHPNLFVELEVLENEQYKDKIKVLAASNALPDVGFTWAAGYLEPFVNGNLFAPLNDVLNDGLSGQFVSGTTEAYAIDGKTYGLPLELNIAPVFYNKKIFRDNNLDVPTGYDEFVMVVKTLADNGITPIALGNKERWTGSLWYMYLADRIGGTEVLNNAINRTGSFEHPALISAAAEIQRLVKLGAFSRGFNGLANADAKAQFLNGQAAMWLIGSWELPSFTTDEEVPQSFRDRVSFFKFPPIEGGKGDIDSWVGGPGVGLFIAQNSEVKEEAGEFTKFFIDEWGKRSVTEAGVIPATKVDTSDVDLPQMYLDVLDELNNASNLTLFADVQMGPSVAQTHLDMIQALFGLQVTPEEFARSHEEALRAS